MAPKRKPKTPDLIQELKSWLKTPGNSKAKLAAMMGYKTSESISRWITRGRVAEREVEKLREILG